MKTSNSHSIKLENMSIVMEKLIETREITRIDLSRITTLNKATISSIINEFSERKLVIETDQIIKTSGRSARVFALNKNAARIISIELLPNSVYGVITNLYGEILFELNTEVLNTEFSNYLKVLLFSIDELRKNTFDSVYGIIGIGIGIYGILSKNKRIKYAIFNSWKDIDLKEIIEEYTSIPTYVENEANISAISEFIAQNRKSNIVSLNIGVGVGMGIIINENLYTGEDGYAGEIGHTIVFPNGRKCVCGNHGCLETYISLPAILKNYFDLSGKNITISEFIRLYQEKEEFAIKIYNEFTDVLSISINNISQMLNPNSIVIKSKITDEIPETLSIVKNKLRSNLMHLELLTNSTYKSKTNVIGLTHVLIKKFLDIKNHNFKL